MSEPNLDWTQIVAEKKIQEAIEAGEFENVPGMGEPVDLSVDPFTPAHLRIANKILKNARALPEWLQLEKDIQRETAALGPSRERGLNAVRFAKNAPSRERAATRLRIDYRDRVDAVNTLILKYCFIAPASAQRPFAPYNLKREMALLDEAIANAAAVAAVNTAEPSPPRRRRW